MLLNKFSFKYYLNLICGLCIGLSPLIVFELKHNFYNLHIVSLILSNGLTGTISWPFPSYYFLSLIPFLFLLTAIVLNKLIIKNRFLAVIIISIFIFYSLRLITTPSTSGYTMPEGWNFPGYQKVSKIIVEENVDDFNVVSLLSGDMRDYPLRFLLTVSYHPPLPVEQYPQSLNLFVLARENQLIINNPVWEISSFCPCQITKEWVIQNKIKLYLLKKIPAF